MVKTAGDFPKVNIGACLKLPYPKKKKKKKKKDEYTII